VSIHSVGEIVGSDVRFSTPPFLASAASADWQTAFGATFQETVDSPAGHTIWDARTGHVILKLGSKEQEAFNIVRWASSAIAQIGERAVPVLERAAVDETFDPGARAFASFELARRALANPRIVLEEGGAELILKRHTSMALPGSRGSVYLSADEFQRRTVLVWVTPSIGAPLLEEHPLAQGKEVSFSLGGKNYGLRLEDVLFATEQAVFAMREMRAR